ncbi:MULTISPECIES: hypothetical protein [Candidatus Ichthyocystis]|uniref:hypothetical protein n=1 Tax=Candidatus Ichthyocystis TaxID=2929841 RepID=UPI000B858A7E|nr:MULTISPECIES: hypothetical protein [Ichthyocystis]
MWHRKNRRSAKLHKVRGQELTAERTAKPDDVTKNKGESNEIDISGLIVARHKVTETRSGRVGKKSYLRS